MRRTKSFVFAVVVLAMMVSFATVALADGGGLDGFGVGTVVNCFRLNVRSAPSNDGAVVYILRAYEVVTVNESSAGWFKVSFFGRDSDDVISGWVFGRYLAAGIVEAPPQPEPPAPPAPPEPPAPPPDLTMSGFGVVYNCWRLNVRSAPSNNGVVVYILSLYDVVGLLSRSTAGQKDLWYQIHFTVVDDAGNSDVITGWVFNAYLDIA